MADPSSFSWGKVDRPAFSILVRSCYEEVIHWRRNLSKVPSGKVVILFVKELTKPFQGYADGSNLECVALYTAMIFPHLLLQRPQGKSTTKALSSHLERRLSSWLSGDID